jgi:N-dimethylarginine dimethylaminohydrolase
VSATVAQQAARTAVRVHVLSETAALRTVLMRLAAPFTVGLDTLGALLDPRVRRQWRHNRWAPYRMWRAQAQQLALKQTLEAHGARVILAPPLRGSTSAHFVRDVGFAIDDTFFVARMGTRYHQREVYSLEGWWSRLHKVARLASGRIEGGDVMLAHGRVLVGLGEATDAAGVAALRSALETIGNGREVVELRFGVPGVVHLDTKLNLVAPNLALVARASFEPSSLRWLERHVHLVDATPEETAGIQVNALAIGHGRVILDARAERIANELSRYGLEPVLLEYSEVTRSPGSFRCTTLPLERGDEGSSLPKL